MTRAKDELTLTLADRRLVYGRVQYRQPSRFVEELPAAAIEERGKPSRFASFRSTLFDREVTPPRGGGHRTEVHYDFDSQAEPEESGDLRRGRRVRHPRYGIGTILSQEGSGDDTRLTVYFERAGKKKFVARYADLSPL
jgi:ATP-dependent DNA helicase UvrD/PcrA